MFLQEIAILFIYYLFHVLLDLIDFGNEKILLYTTWHFSSFSILPDELSIVLKNEISSDGISKCSPA